MAVGKEAGSFASAITSMTKSRDAAGNHTFVIDVEGTVASGWSGAVVGIISGTSADFKLGTYTADFAAYLDDGNVLSGVASGVIGGQEGYQWQLNGVALNSEGSRVTTEGVLELANRTYNGKMFAIS
jgi:hypothetical protein